MAKNIPIEGERLKRSRLARAGYREQRKLSPQGGQNLFSTCSSITRSDTGRGRSRCYADQKVRLCLPPALFRTWQLGALRKKSQDSRTHQRHDSASSLARPRGAREVS